MVAKGQAKRSSISSESQFVLRQLLFVIKAPFLFLLVLLGKKQSKDLLQPLDEFFQFLFEPRLTVALILINCLVYIAQFFMSQDMLMNLIFQPSDLFTGNIIPIITSWFLHGSLAHLLGNMLFLYIFGRIIEHSFGSIKMIMIYFGSAFIADIVSALAGQGGIGASGAISGLVAAAILIKPFYLTYLIMGIPLPIILLGWMAILSDVSGILYPKNDGIGHFAHMGGYLAISLLVFILNREDREKMKIGLIINTVFVTVYLILISFFL